MKGRILAHLPEDHPWKEGLLVFDTIGSTNTHALQLAKAGSPEGTVVLARQQTAGRGRLGRTFLSPLDAGLYLSVILRPQCLPTQLMHLTCAVAVTVCDTIEELTGLRPGIKWINDLVLNKRKLAGILTELGFTPQGLVDYAVVGIGINISHIPEELQGMACSLFSEIGVSLDPSVLAARLMVNLEAMSRRLLSRQEPIMEQYRKDCITLGAEVKVISPSQTRQARVLDICDDGSLIALFPDGHQETVSCGEVSVRGLWDYV